MDIILSIRMQLPILQQGIGEPEPSKHNSSGYWSRRITEEHRIVYKQFEHGNPVLRGSKLVDCGLVIGRSWTKNDVVYLR